MEKRGTITPKLSTNAKYMRMGASAARARPVEALSVMSLTLIDCAVAESVETFRKEDLEV